MYLAGPTPLKLLFHGFVVLVGTLILSGAVNTAIIGSNGVLNRVAEDGVLPDWFRKPHPKYGTTFRLINTLVLLQLLTIVLSRGDVYALGEAYAFGVVWSFAMKSLSVLVLRFKQPEKREWKVPLNLRFGKVELPIGLALITIVLFLLAGINVLTKKTATIAGSAFTVAFFVLFESSELYNRRRKSYETHGDEKFRLDIRDEISAPELNVRPGNVLVAVRNPNRMDHLRRILEKTDTHKVDVIVLSVHNVTQAGSGEHALTQDQIFSSNETTVFSKVVAMAEKAGKHVQLMVVPGRDPYAAVVQTAARLQSARLVMGLSPKLSASEQGKVIGEQWERLPQPRPSLSLELVLPDQKQSLYFNLGPHPPRLWPEDVQLLHELWLELCAKGFGAKLHHRDVVGVALRRMRRQLDSDASGSVVGDVALEITYSTAPSESDGPPPEA
jgi:hypothetical protein